MMGKINSRDKGKRNELALAHKLQEYGYNTRRGQQFSGLYGDADVIGLDGVHIECKAVERLNVHEAMEQSIRDAREGEKPTVMHKKNRSKWLVTMPLDEWVELYEAWRREQTNESRLETISED